MCAQLSVELLVVLVILLGLALLVAGVLMKSANKASEKVEQKAVQVFNSTDKAYATGKAGDYCASDSDCSSGTCNTYSSKCL